MAPVVVCRPTPATGAEPERDAQGMRWGRRAPCHVGRPMVFPFKAVQPRSLAQGTKRQLIIAADPARPLRRRLAAPDAAAKPLPRPGVDLRSLSAIVVNLDRRPDRMEGCSTRMQAHAPWLRMARFSATDGRETKISTSEVTTSWHSARNVHYQKLRSVRKGWDDLGNYTARRLPLSAGERGCASSHVRAWRHCLEAAGGSEKPLLVLEDDAAPTPQFTQVLSRALAALPSDAGILYLGYSQAAEWRREITPELVEAEYVWTTVAYLIWPSAARTLLGRLPVNEPVDNWMAGASAERAIKAYCVRPKIVLQADAWNVNSDVAHSDEHYWGPDSDITHTGAEHGMDRVPLLQKSCLLGDGDSDSDSDEDM